MHRANADDDRLIYMFGDDNGDVDDASDMDGIKDNVEDDYIRTVVETVVEYCPVCNSTKLEQFLFGKQSVIRCNNCKTYLCQTCLSVLEEQAGPAGPRLKCPKGHLF